MNQPMEKKSADAPAEESVPQEIRALIYDDTPQIYDESIDYWGRDLDDADYQ